MRRRDKSGAPGEREPNCWLIVTLLKVLILSQASGQHSNTAECFVPQCVCHGCPQSVHIFMNLILYVLTFMCAEADFFYGRFSVRKPATEMLEIGVLFVVGINARFNLPIPNLPLTLRTQSKSTFPARTCIT